MKLPVICLLAMAWCATVHAADPAKGFETSGLNIGYMPDQELGRRVKVPELAGYVKRIQAECTGFFADATTPENLDIVIAVRPGKIARVWFISSRTPAVAEKRDELRTKLEAVAAADVSAPIALAIEGKIAGGDPKLPKHSDAPPVPAEWQEAFSKLAHTAQFDEVLAAVWPDTAATVAAAVKAAESSNDGFVTQVLEPTGGKIPRPKDWFYAENHHDTVYEWTLSKEDPAGHHPYTTGVRVQAFVGVKEKTGKTAKQFILDFVSTKQKEAAKLVETCEPEDQGMFTRMCVETDEGPRHMRYSLFWGSKDLDLAVITEAGTTKDLWKTYAGTFDRMCSFELIDMKRFEAKQEFKIPAGVHYKEATAEVNEQAKQLLLARFSPKTPDAEVLSLFEAKLVCGPGLWREIKDDPEMAKLTKGKVSIHVNADVLEGKLFQSPDEVLLFWKALLRAVDPSGFTIRKLSEEEIKIYWAMISFDIEEPLFIMETPKHKILVNFVADKGLKILWIDDLQNLHMKEKAP